MKKYGLIAVLLLSACSKDREEESSLAAYLSTREVVQDNVIACAASAEFGATVSVFLYPRPGALNIRYFEALSGTVEKDDFEGYVEVKADLLDVFNGYLKKFDVRIPEEKWVIVSFEENDKVHISNPIRIKHLSKPTAYLPNNLHIQDNTIHPLITWEDGPYTDTRIYFQVISDADNNLISGTYTFDTFFKFYDLGNVVLNITQGVPEELQQGATYGCTLMGVSEDNWVNLIAEKRFVP